MNTSQARLVLQAHSYEEASAYDLALAACCPAGPSRAWWCGLLPYSQPDRHHPGVDPLLLRPPLLPHLAAPWPPATEANLRRRNTRRTPLTALNSGRRSIGQVLRHRCKLGTGRGQGQIIMDPRLHLVLLQHRPPTAAAAVVPPPPPPPPPPPTAQHQLTPTRSLAARRVEWQPHRARRLSPPRQCRNASSHPHRGGGARRAVASRVQARQ